ncbi:undecaprenol kinase/diacylglycerol kinase (ATP) [Halobacillus karajensis]|uniref:diacylglycerol kinase family protein n=1 Tax=Halobacillus karajensis TaxID=195088 RepID=UPI0008A809BB|nr:diacylglycerol kinase family protein [Halobacillus karajensis]SEH60526.1 undecaprenol kinase/diacylglycerol kinase (ATP) [Halobacillus karajensis]
MSSDFKGRNQKNTVGFRFAWNGIVWVFKAERNFRIHLAFALLVIVSAFLLKVSLWEWTAIMIIISLVLTLEMINTAMERLLDHFHPEIHPVIGSIKDITAGAVLVASISSVFIGLIIFLPKLFAL